MSEHTLDTSRLLCPMPVIRTQNKVNELSDGDTLVITCTDPGVLNDIPAWCRINGHEVIGTEKNADDIIITVLVKHL
ncbi:MAG: sulfurtransferase TusA family protein [Gammaproteobacteria bacterium]|nr:sulfurtransferase TusA family protein [Gammaproteobacteria bacterium]